MGIEPDCFGRLSCHTMSPFIIDGHLDIACNALGCQRDQTLPLSELRHRDVGSTDGRGTAMVSLPELRRANVGIVMATLFTRCKADDQPGRTIARENTDYVEPCMVHAAAMAQLAYYRALQHRGEVNIITSTRQLHDAVEPWRTMPVRLDASAKLPVGLIITMECADPVLDVDDLRQWFDAGLRGLSLAHYGAGRYASGTPRANAQLLADGNGPLTYEGMQLLHAMHELPLALDLAHLSDASFEQALELFDGPVYASHANCRALCDTPRQLTNEQIRRIIERDGVIGCVMHNGMIRTDWQPEQDRQQVSLRHVVNHVDHICQLAGSAKHVAIGSDLDGGFGNEKCPAELDTIADLHRLSPLLSERGMTDDDIAMFNHGNWLRFWQGVLK